MTNTLIADGGSTKVEWIGISEDTDILPPFSTKGLNAAMTSEQEALDYFISVKAALPENFSPSKIHYYGAGCATQDICDRIRSAISTAWQSAEVEVGSDMLGTVRALLGKQPGVASILGTGSNSALFDGEKIIANIPPLGFILGDEGSGTALGKRLLGDIFKRLAPSDISEKFHNKYHLNLSDVIENVYRKPGANSFIASFVPFLKENISHPYCRDIVMDTFRIFFDRNIKPYSLAAHLKVSFSGSISYQFQDLLKKSASECGVNIGRIIAKPIPELVKYHIEYDKDN